MNKPIIRWTVGQVSKNGLDCLKLCFNKFAKFYKDEFRYFLCFNDVDEKLLDWTKNFNIELIDQNSYKESLIINPIKNHSCWKLYPPRIDNNAYEIFVDNDLVLHKKFDFNYFFENNKFFMCEGISPVGAYGTFQDKINYKYKLNAGLFGIPPQYDFQKEINDVLDKNKINWDNDYFEEQGLVSYILHQKKCEVITLDKIFICFERYKVGEYGVHFVGLNSNNDLYWKIYKSKSILL